MRSAPNISLANSALAAIRQWRFEPMRDGEGKVMAMWAVVPIQFTID